MARARRQGPTISLFSFQDIVTSVMGIMLIVTLLLALDLVNRETQHGSVAAEDLSPTAQADLQKIIEQLEHRKSQLLAASEKNAAEISALGTMSGDELRKANSNAERDTQRLRGEIERLSKRRDELQEIRRQQALQAPQLERQEQELDIQRESLEKEQARLEAVKQDTRVRFSVQRGSNRSGWLVDLGTAAISVVPLDRAGSPIVFSHDSEAVRREAFIQWLRRAKEPTYLFFVVRPDTTETFHTLRSAIESMRVTFGFDIVGANQPVLDGPNGR